MHATPQMTSSFPEVVIHFCIVISGVPCWASAYYGMLIGDFPDTSQHDVSGTVYAADKDTLIVVDFIYDGTAPGEEIPDYMLRWRYFIPGFCSIGCTIVSFSSV